jgi:hypothetical protein
VALNFPGAIRSVTGLVRGPTVLASMFGVLGSQLIENVGDLVLLAGEKSSRRQEALAQRLGLFDVFGGVAWLAGLIPFGLRDRPVDRRLLPLATRRRTLQRRLVAVEAVASSGQKSACPLDGFVRMP